MSTTPVVTKDCEIVNERNGLRLAFVDDSWFEQIGTVSIPVICGFHLHAIIFRSIDEVTASGTADGYGYTLTSSPSPPHSPPINMPPPIPPRPVIRQSSFTKIGYMINTAVNGTKKQFSSGSSSSSSTSGK
uniref:Uncharacterized protein n=1 Tax=Anopheles farauti TaxID=69004 RepID=A0A182QSS5_9DIPT